MPRRLAFVYHPKSFATLEIAGAARGLCDLLWVVDRAIVPEGADAMVRVLQRLGSVVDVTGLTPEAAAGRIAAERPDAILSLADSLLEWTADVARRLGLAFMSPATARALADKEAQRAALRDAGMLVPRSWRVPDAGDAAGWAALARAATFPAVLKPRRGEASRNTVKVTSPAELEEVLAEIARSTPGDRAGLQLEEYIRDRDTPVDRRFADYLSVESVVSAGRVTHLGITGRLPMAPPFRETGFFLPGAPPPDVRDAVLAVATDAAGAVGLRAGTLHTEIKLTPDGPCVIEVNGRMGGSVCGMVRRVAGWDLMAVALRLALGEEVAVQPLPPAEAGRIGFQLLMQPPRTARRVESLDGLDAVRTLPGVDEIFLNRGAGAEFDWRAGTNEFVLQLDGLVGDLDALPALYASIDELLDVTYA
jgi:biotin carboxylase